MLLAAQERKRLMSRRQYKAEGSFADAANNHGFKRMRIRGIEKAKIQNLMIAAIQNLRKLIHHTSRRSADSACNLSPKLLLVAENTFNQAFLGLEKLFQPI